MTSKQQNPAQLTARQREVLELVSKGLTNPEICRVLGISRGTVKIHLAAIYRALDVTNRTEAAVAFSELGGAAAGGSPSPGAGPPPPGRALAVLPFDVFGGGADDADFADGLVEELITRLSKFAWFPVIARQSTFQYARRANDLARAGRELGAAYLVEGSVRRADGRVRVTVQLIEAAGAAHVWAQTFDFAFGDVFLVQDEIARGVAAALHPELLHAAGSGALSDANPRPDAWLIAMRGHAHLERRDRVENERALACFERASALDPTCLLAAFGSAMAHYHALFLQWAPDPAAAIGRVLEAAEHCARIAPHDPYSLCAQGIAALLRGDLERAIAKLQAAVERNPSFSRGYSFLGQLVGMRGDPDEGIRWMEEAIRLSPRDPALFSMLGAVGIAHLVQGRLPQAYDYFHRSLELRDAEPLIWVMLVATTALLGRKKEARLALGELKRVSPDFSLAKFERIASPAQQRYLEQIRRGLRAAGYEEPASA